MNNNESISSNVTLSMDCFMEELKNRLNEYYKDEYSVSIKIMTKNNDRVRHGLSILKRGSNVSPTIYLDEAYADYIAGYKSLGEVASEVIAARRKCKEYVDFEAEQYLDYEWVRSRLGIKLIGRSLNHKLLKDIPHVDFSDMAIIFYVEIDDDNIGRGAIVVRKEHMDEWSINIKRLYTDAMNNAMQKEQPVLEDMMTMLMDIYTRRYGEEGSEDFKAVLNEIKEGTKERSRMYVLSNQSKNNGASVIAYPGMLHDIGESLGCDFYILPSSIHELIILPVIDDTEHGYRLSELVKEVNETKLDPENVLSNHAYRYHRNTNWLEALCEAVTDDPAG